MKRKLLLGVAALTATLINISSTQPLMAQSDEFTQAVLNAHNNYRKQHKNTENLSYDEAIAKSAQEHAKKLVELGDLVHAQGNYGENLSVRYTTDPTEAVKQAVADWYEEEKDYKSAYGADAPPASPAVTGHFTQVVWKSTTKVGCGTAQGAYKGQPGYSYVVCRYTPSGNFENEYKDNVQPRN